MKWDVLRYLIDQIPEELNELYSMDYKCFVDSYKMEFVNNFVADDN